MMTSIDQLMTAVVSRCCRNSTNTIRKKGTGSLNVPLLVLQRLLTTAVISWRGC